MGNAVGQAQNKLGELFVDIGVGGLGQTLKALNSVSATFLLAKNAATQLVKPIVDMGVQTANSAVGIGKMAAALGTTKENAQKLAYHFKQFKLEGLENDIAKIQSMYAGFQNRTNGIPIQFENMLRRFGESAGMQLSWKNYASGDFKDVMRMFNDLRTASKNSTLSAQQQIALLESGGINSLWKYAFEKDEFDIDGWINITDEEIQKEIELAETMEKLKNSIDQLKQKVVNKIIDSGVIDKLNYSIDKLFYLMGGNATQKDVNTIKNVVRGSAVVGGGATGALLLSPLGLVGVGVGFVGGATAALLKTNQIIGNKPNGTTADLLPLANYTPASMGSANDTMPPKEQLTPQGIEINNYVDINNSQQGTNATVDTRLDGDIPDLAYIKQTTQNTVIT